MLSNEVVVAVDSTRIKVTTRMNEFIRNRRFKGGWIKVHAIIDVKTNEILRLEVTDESIRDDTMFELLIDQTTKHSDVMSVQQVLGWSI